MATTYLCIIADRQALAWVLTSRQMAFPTTRRSEVDALEEGDELLLTTTRGCFRNPARDRTRVIGRAVLTSPPLQPPEPIELIGRTFDRTCFLQVTHLAPVLTGVELAPLVEHLGAFPNKTAWPIFLRRPLLRLLPADADMLRDALTAVAQTPDTVIPGYVARGTPPPRR